VNRELTLNENATVILNAFGDGTAQLGPHGHGVEWRPDVASVKTNQTPPINNEATCQIYVGHAPTADNFVDSTFTGSSGDASGNVRVHLRVGSSIFAVWHNGDAGAQATLTVVGTQVLEQ